MLIMSGYLCLEEPHSLETGFVHHRHLHFILLCFRFPIFSVFFLFDIWIQLGTTPLHAAAKAGHRETVELLLNAGIFRDAKTKVDRTALQMAAEEGHTDIVQMLINHGADVNTKDMLKMTALHWAVQHSHYDTVSLLLQHSADVTAINKFGKSPLDIACDNSSESIFKLIQVKLPLRYINVS